MINLDHRCLRLTADEPHGESESENDDQCTMCFFAVVWMAIRGYAIELGVTRIPQATKAKTGR